jgi:hypothetical protein
MRTATSELPKSGKRIETKTNSTQSKHKMSFSHQNSLPAFASAERTGKELPERDHAVGKVGCGDVCKQPQIVTLVQFLATPA